MKIRLMFDSGAYSAWTQGDTIDLQAYISYIKEHESLFDSYVNLDMIPGKPKVRRTQQDVHQSAIQSRENFRVMKKAGLNPVPVFHQGEDFSWLERLVGEGEPYIGISPSSDRIKHDLHWLERCFEICSKNRGIKTHGFGVMSPDALSRFGWFSADSATWAKAAGNAVIVVPTVYTGDGKPDFTKPAMKLGISDRGGSSRNSFNSLGDAERHFIERYLQDEFGVSVVYARHDVSTRQRTYLWFYKHMSEALGVRIIFATQLNNPRFGELMNEMGIQDRLLSYFETRALEPKALREFAHTGKARPVKGRIPKQNWQSAEYLNFRAKKLLERGESGPPPPK